MTLNITRKNITFVVALFAFLVVGVSFYCYIQKQKSSSSQKLSSQKEVIASKKQIIKDAEEYLISKHSIGSLVRTVEISLKYNEDSSAYALISDEKVPQIRKYLDVILHAQDGTIMPLGGKIQTITPTEDSQLKIDISLPKDTETEFLSNDAKIITLEDRNAQRFPLNAIQKDSEGNLYVWGAGDTDQMGVVKVKKIELDNPVIGDNNFSNSLTLGFYTKLILNPDDKIEDGQIYKMTEAEYQYPLQNPIRQAYHDNMIKYIQNALKKARDDGDNCVAAAKRNVAQAGEGAASKGQSAACINKAIAGGKTATPMDIFNSILQRQPGAKARTQGTCGSSACNAQ